MRGNGIRAQPGYRTRRYLAGKTAALILNLVKGNFEVSRRNKLWVTDITYGRTWEGWLYVAVALDVFSRKIIGWAAHATIHRELALDVSLMAVRTRQPKDTIIHSD